MIGSVARQILERLRQTFTDPGQVLAIVLVLAFVARAVWFTLPVGGLIFDEAYYVNAVRVLLGLHVDVGAHYAGSPIGLDPNQEHPPLSKLLIALSMLIFGDNGLGWRFPSLVAGMIALGALYLIVRAAGESRWLGVLAVAFFGFDNLSVVHGRIGTLDMLVLAPMLLGAWLALRGRWLAAGILMAIATLMKLTGVYGVAALLTWLAVEQLGRWRRGGLRARWRTERRIDLGMAKPAALMLVGYVVVFVVGLGILDARFTSFPGPIDHLRHMIEYGANLAKTGGGVGTCSSNDSAPWQWLVNDCEMTYLRVDVTTRAGDTIISSHPSIDFRGAMNPILIGTFALGLSAAIWLAVRRGSRLARWAVIWGAANYLPYVLLVLVKGRITYLYYFLPVIPALAVMVALLLLRSGLPRAVLWGYVVAFAIGFAAYFPFRQIP